MPREVYRPELHCFCGGIAHYLTDDGLNRGTCGVCDRQFHTCPKCRRKVESWPLWWEGGCTCQAVATDISPL